MIRNVLRLLVRGSDLLDRIARDARTAANAGTTSIEHAAANQRQLTSTLTELQATVTALQATLTKVQKQVRDVSGETRTRFRQYQLQLGRLARAVDKGGLAAAADPRLAAQAIPVEPPPAEPLRWETIAAAHPDPDGNEWVHLDACPVCGHAQLTEINPWNKLLLLPVAPDDDSARYDYAICHACGVVSATRRPVGSRYRFLLEHFEEVTAKRGGGRIVNPILNPSPLDDDDRAQLRELASPGVFVSDLSAVGRSKAYLPGLLRDRFDSSGHVDIIGALLEPRGQRVLEVRAKTGALVDGLRRMWGADVCSMPIWESQQWLVGEFYGIPVSPPIDFDRFTIPFEGQFDLIVCQHMLTHALRPAAFLGELRRKLRPGGHIYLYNEPDDIEILSKGQSMIAHLNPLHMQTFDQQSLQRGLAANGFEIVFLKRHDLEHICVARMSPDARMTPLAPAALDARIARYRHAFDLSILRLGPTLRPRVAGIWTATVERAVAAGIAEFDKAGILRLVAE